MFAIEYKNEIWREDAACAELGVPTGIFFSEDLGDIARAKRICADCPSLTLCLEAAIDRNEPWGVWGGQLFRKGKIDHLAEKKEVNMAIGLSTWFKTTFLGYEEKKIRTRDEDGKYVGDDKSTPDINEAYTTVAIKPKKDK